MIFLYFFQVLLFRACFNLVLGHRPQDPRLRNILLTFDCFLCQVNAFDHVRILEFSQSKRFHLNILPRNKESKKRKSSGYTDIDDRQRKNFSSNTIGYPGGSDLSAGASRRRLDEASASAAEVSRVGEHRVISLRRSDDDFEDAESTVELVSIVPWLNGHGAVHPSMSKSLTRRVMGIVSLHPGIAEVREITL